MGEVSGIFEKEIMYSIDMVYMKKIEKAINRPGYDALWDWFSISYASFCVMPRVCMHAMPDAWQKKMADLLYEWDATWDWPEEIKTTSVCLKGNDNRFMKIPPWVLNYRHPDNAFINSLKRKKK